MKEKMFKENFERLKNLYKTLKRDEESVLFASDQLNKQLIKKVKKSRYEKDSVFINLYDKVKHVNIEEENTVPYLRLLLKVKKILTSLLFIVLMGLFNCFMLTLPIYVFFQSRPSTPNIVCCLLICLLKKFTPIQ